MNDQHVDTIIASTEAARRDRNRTNRLVAVAAMAASLAVVLSVVLSFVIYQQKVTERESNGDRIDALTEELRRAQDTIDFNDSANRAELECQHRFDVLVHNVSMEYLVSIGNLVVVLAQNPSEAPGRDTLVGETLAEIDRRLVSYRQAVNQLNVWRDTIPPEPCPLP